MSSLLMSEKTVVPCRVITSMRNRSDKLTLVASAMPKLPRSGRKSVDNFCSEGDLFPCCDTSLYVSSFNEARGRD